MVFDWRNPAQVFMGTPVIASVQPIVPTADCRRHNNRVFRCIRSCESLDMGVLRGFAWLDVIERNALALRPLESCVGDELGVVVQANGKRCARTSTSSLSAQTTCAAGGLVSISMRSPSRLNSLITLKVRNRRPDHSASDMKS